jgi:hypothetical protein
MKKLIILVTLFAVTAFAQNPPGTKPGGKTPIIGNDPLVPRPATPKAEAPEPVAAPEPPEKVVARFFAYLQRGERGDVEQAYSQLVRGTKIAQRPEDVKMLKDKTNDAIAYFGAIQGYEIVETKKVGEHLMSYTIISLGKDFPLRWRFYFYRVTENWRLIDMRVDDRLAAMFDEPTETRMKGEQ